MSLTSHYISQRAQKHLTSHYINQVYKLFNHSKKATKPYIRLFLEGGPIAFANSLNTNF